MRETSLSNYMKLGDKLRAARKQANKTQKEMAREVGIAHTTYSNYENGNREPGITVLTKIANVLGVSTADLIGWETDNVLLYKEADNEAVVKLGENILKYNKKAQLNTAFDKLNASGQSEAVKRVEELAEIPRYQNDTKED